MSKVTINGRLLEGKKTEFYLTIETLKNLIKKNCKEFLYELSEENNLKITITFDNYEKMKNFDNLEFSILKGSIRNLCRNIEIDTYGKMG